MAVIGNSTNKRGEIMLSKYKCPKCGKEWSMGVADDWSENCTWVEECETCKEESNNDATM